MAVSQIKGNVGIAFGTIIIKNLAEDSITYDLPELGDTLSALDTVVHLRQNPASVVSGITVNIVKGSDSANQLVTAFNVGTPLPLTIKDDGNDLEIHSESMNPTQVAISNSTGGNDVETYSFTFKGNIKVII